MGWLGSRFGMQLVCGRVLQLGFAVGLCGWVEQLKLCSSVRTMHLFFPDSTCGPAQRRGCVCSV